MSDENTTIVRRAVEAWQRGDFEGLAEVGHPEIEVHIPENPDFQLFLGRDGAQAAIDNWSGAFEDYSFEVERVEAEGDRVLVIAIQSGRGRMSGVEMREHTANVMTVRDGLISRWEIYTNVEDGEAAFRRESGR